ncbi:MAG: hypothetical protein M0006_11720 [Magnetospirillum sp.]|nr:hypothetical protein [Magnetospirillum sp.]
MSTLRSEAAIGRRTVPEPMRRRLAEMELAAARLQRAAAGMALLADLPSLRDAVLAGDADTVAAGLEALAVAAFRVCEGARTVALGVALLDHEVRRCFGDADKPLLSDRRGLSTSSCAT